VHVHLFYSRGFKEKGTITTSFDMCVLNDLDGFHLVGDVIDVGPVWRPEPHMPSKPCRTN
jgi:phosphoketolase